MSNLDDIFEQQPKQEFDREAYAARKQSDRAEVYALAEETASSLGDPAKLRQYLDVQARFPLHSVNNALLIAAQMPAAAKVRDFDAWKELDVSVNKGAKGIRILEPGGEYTGDDGKKHTGYNVKRVFDISQTNAPPAQATQMSPEVTRDERQLLKALVDKSPVPCIASNTVPEGKTAHFDGKNIHVRRGCEAAVLFPAIAAEMAAVQLGAGFHADCAAYIICRQHGFEPPEVGGQHGVFTGAAGQEIRAELGKIKDAADKIGKRMYNNLHPQKSDKTKEPET